MTAPILAQEKQDSISYQTIEEVEIVETRPTSSAAGSSLDFIYQDRSFFLQNQGNTFMNTLEKLPGIRSIQTGVGIAKPVIRGMSVNRVIVNEYGIKQEGQQWGMDHGLEIDQFNVDRVEIIKGPVAVLYGSDGIGGIVNILNPEIPSNDTFQADVLLNYKSGNNLWGGSISALKQKKGVYTRARASYQNYGNYRVPASTFTYNGYVLPIHNHKLKNTGGRELNFSLLNGVVRKWGESSLYLSNYRQQAGFFPGAFGIPRSYQLNPAESPRKIALPNQVINHFKIVSNTRLNMPAGNLFADLAYQYNMRQELSVPHSHGWSSETPGQEALKLDLQTWTGNLRYELWLHGAWKNIFGISLQHQQNKRGGYEFLIPDYKSSQGGMFYYSQLEFNPNLLLSGGFRWDLAAQQAAATYLFMPDSNGTTPRQIQRSPGINKRYSNFSWGLGMAYRPFWNWEFKVNAGSAFRLPAMAELSSNGIHHGTFRHEKGNADLEAEKGYLFDLSGKYQSRHFSLSVSPFLNLFSNYIYLSPSARFSSLPEGGQVYQYQSTKATFIGFETDWSWKITPFLNYQGGMEYVWNQNHFTRLPLPFTPPFSLFNELNFESTAASGILKHLHLGINGHYFAGQYRVDRNEKTTPGYFLLNLSASRTFGIASKKLGFFVQVRNLTNTRYLNNMSRYRILNLPEQGLNILLTLRLEV